MKGNSLKREAIKKKEIGRYRLPLAKVYWIIFKKKTPFL